MFEEKLKQYLVDNGIRHTERTNSYTLYCPQCSRFKLDINRQEGFYSCYYCNTTNGTHGSNPEFILSDITGQSVKEISRFLKGIVRLTDFNLEDMYGDNKSKNTIQDQQNDEFTIPKDFLSLTHPKSIDGLNYLENKRGVPEWLASTLGILYSLKYSQIIFPVYDNQKCVGYQGRAIYGKVKYNNVKKSKYLLFESTISNNGVILAEGPISAIKFAKCKIGFVASMGKSVAEEQIQRLKDKKVDTIYLALDRDAWREIDVFYKKYYKDFTIYKIDVPEHRDDFGDCTFDEALQAFQEAYPYTNNHNIPQWG